MIYASNLKRLFYHRLSSTPLSYIRRVIMYRQRLSTSIATHSVLSQIFRPTFTLCVVITSSIYRLIQFI